MRLRRSISNREQIHGVIIALLVMLLTNRVGTAVELSGRIKSISADKTEITIERSTGRSNKDVTLGLSPHALDGVTYRSGTFVHLTYDPEEELVTRVQASWFEEKQTPSENKIRSVAKQLLIKPNSLAGWTPLRKDSPLRWQVKGTTLVATGDGVSIRTDQSYRDFKFHCEFLLSHRCNSGIFLRGCYEIAFLDSAWRDRAGKLPPPTAQTGAIWGQTAPIQLAYKGSGAWNTMDVTLISNSLTVNLNGVDVLKNLKLFEPTQGALPNQDPLFGPLIIQSHSNMRGTSFRNMWIEEL